VPSKSSTGIGFGLGVLSAATFGTSGVFARSLIDAGWTPEAAVTVRVGIASILLAVPAAVALRGRWWVAGRAWRSIASYGFLAVAGSQVCFFNAIQHLPIGIALLLEYSGVILVVAWMWAVHGQRPRRLTIAGTVAALAGLALVLDLTGGARLDPVGVLWGLGAAVGLAAYYVLSARIDAQLPSVALACGGMGLGAALLLVLGALGAAPMHASLGQVTLAGHQTSVLAPIAGLSLIAALVSYVAGIGAARILGAPMSSFVGLTEVMFAVLFAWLALGELPTAVQAVGGVLIVAGIALVRVDLLRPDTAPASAAPPPLAASPASAARDGSAEGTEPALASSRR
jgi:drug/metabolite transporter (DMT)-like permease